MALLVMSRAGLSMGLLSLAMSLLLTSLFLFGDVLHIWRVGVAFIVLLLVVVVGILRVVIPLVVILLLMLVVLGMLPLLHVAASVLLLGGVRVLLRVLFRVGRLLAVLSLFEAGLLRVVTIIVSSLFSLGLIFKTSSAASAASTSAAMDLAVTFLVMLVAASSSASSLSFIMGFFVGLLIDNISKVLALGALGLLLFLLLLFVVLEGGLLAEVQTHGLSFLNRSFARLVELPSAVVVLIIFTVPLGKSLLHGHRLHHFLVNGSLAISITHEHVLGQLKVDFEVLLQIEIAHQFAVLGALVVLLEEIVALDCFILVGDREVEPDARA
uniref:Uncharacterized protein n=1 Tax=Strombidium inclinatum TaxID=197538 RepID=A0A7S3IZ36_9SPIT|mmetsp:Transcript_5682/g.9007  ORF Transcript_5682/g.9007 Transcript_5682/m.9007 type:complete len:326 (+) Transcript_5682:274-1251(+)|eukprot:CAMPEP_0170483870 /NCGR_PEP_ID=MMETSP0208-20121228/3467_1 /TAXON_ID=197538 /ORGANISM="Strombidium inclinatum, Strain S3" /LENGTH=325 /DNA_ID=CAMNT_0010757055 /DNA_START=221 /DNA_END=1198 /DNA_ORIENTATION=+